MDASQRHRRRVAIARRFARRLRADLGPGLKRVTLYGSVARGEDRRGSDVDLLVEVRRRTPSLEARVYSAVTEVSIQDGELLVPIVVSQAEVRCKLSRSFLENVRREGVVLVRS